MEKSDNLGYDELNNIEVGEMLTTTGTGREGEMPPISTPKTPGGRRELSPRVSAVTFGKVNNRGCEGWREEPQLIADDRDWEDWIRLGERMEDLERKMTVEMESRRRRLLEMAGQSPGTSMPVVGVVHPYFTPSLLGERVEPTVPTVSEQEETGEDSDGSLSSWEEELYSETSKEKQETVSTTSTPSCTDRVEAKQMK